jgi:sugar lactone lactonase YvrE
MTTVLDAELVADTRCELGEGPIWDEAAQELVWVDIMASRVLRYRPTDGRVTTIETPSHVGSVAVRQSGGLVGALVDGFWVTDDGPGEWRPFARVGADDPEIRFNDGKCDPRGRFLAGTMRYDKQTGAGALYRLEPDGRVDQILDDVTISNGLAWTPDGGTMYYIDTPTRRVDVFEYDLPAGRMSERRPWLVLGPDEPGNPDGQTIDTDGGLWVAMWGAAAVYRYDEHGRLDVVVRVPASHVTSCTFGGPDLDDLYITCAWSERSDAERAAEPLAGSLFQVRPGRRGHPPVTFAG